VTTGLTQRDITVVENADDVELDLLAQLYVAVLEEVGSTSLTGFDDAHPPLSG